MADIHVRRHPRYGLPTLPTHAGNPCHALLKRAHRELAVFPLIGALCVLLLAGPVFVPGAYLADRGDTAAGVALIAVGSYIASFLTTFFGVALAAAADKALRGEDPSVRDGAAWGSSRSS